MNEQTPFLWKQTRNSWEYFLEESHDFDGCLNYDVKTQLNELGSKGWELVSTEVKEYHTIGRSVPVRNMVMFFKRVKE
jgi:hypothetical protein